MYNILGGGVLKPCPCGNNTRNQMRVRSILIAMAVMFGVLAAGRFLGWIGRPPAHVSSNPTAPPAEPGEPTEAPAHAPPAPVPPPPAPAPAVRPSASSTQPVPPAPALAVPAPGLITDWEQRIDDVLTTKEDENLKVKKLLEIFPNLPEEGQVEAAQHLSNLLPDEQYPALAVTLTNAHSPEAVLDVLMTDVLNRPNPIKLTTLLGVARTPNHPKAEEAHDVLEVFVDEDYGNNWTAWNEAIQKWLKENPDE